MIFRELADIDALRGWLFNLADNAVRFTKPGGEIVIHADVNKRHADSVLEFQRVLRWRT